MITHRVLGDLVTMQMLLGFLLFVFPQVFAENAPQPTPAPLVLPKVTRILGQPVTVTWDDGREATLEVSAPIAEQLSFSTEIVENACEPAERARCDYKAGASAVTYRLVWTKHPDPTHLGKAVIFGSTTRPTRTALVQPTP